MNHRYRHFLTEPLTDMVRQTAERCAQSDRLVKETTELVAMSRPVLADLHVVAPALPPKTGVRAIPSLLTGIGFVFFGVGRAAAQQQTTPMMSNCMAMMGWPMMLGMGLFWLLLLVLMVLAILWLIKQLRT